MNCNLTIKYILMGVLVNVVYSQENLKSVASKNEQLAKTGYTPGEWALNIGVNQEATFGSTYNLSISNFQELVANEYWLESQIGAGFFRNDPRMNIQKVRWYENDLHFSGDLIIAKALSGFDKTLSKSLRPWVGLGFTSVYTGGHYQMGGVIGLGALTWMNETENFGVRFSALDRIYVPDLTGDAGLTHNFFLNFGYQWNL